MMIYRGFTCILIIILLLIAACTHAPSRLDESGKPQREYTYEIPTPIDDGWHVSSLAEEGVNDEIINASMIHVT